MLEIKYCMIIKLNCGSKSRKTIFIRKPYSSLYEVAELAFTFYFGISSILLLLFHSYDSA